MIHPYQGGRGYRRYRSWRAKYKQRKSLAVETDSVPALAAGACQVAAIGRSGVAFLRWSIFQGVAARYLWYFLLPHARTRASRRRLSSRVYVPASDVGMVRMGVREGVGEVKDQPVGGVDPQLLPCAGPFGPLGTVS